MSWVNELASSLGIPAGATTLAAAMYAACYAAEKAARPEALKDVGHVLGSSSWSRSVQAYAIIERVFVWTFGSRHLSWKCALRSLAATIVFNFTFFLAFEGSNLIYTESLAHIVKVGPLVFVAEFLIAGVIADYVALAKTRILIRKITPSRHDALRSAGLVIIDVAASFILSEVFQVLLLVFVIAFYSVPSGYGEPSDLRTFRGIGTDVGAVGIAFSASTLLTSIWTVLILLSTTVLKLLAPLQRFTAWFFDVDKHPLKAIGIVAAALVMSGSLIWAVLRAVI